MGRAPLPVTVYQDILSAWGYLAELRLQTLAAEFGAEVHWTFRPFPLLARSSSLTEAERTRWIEEINQARAESDGRALRVDLWTQDDCPNSSLRPLIAVEAAGLQGERARSQMARALQRAALEQSINVSRMDVLLELASAAALDVDRFSVALNSPRLRRLLLAERDLARERGVNGVPTLVVAGRWMICGLREMGEYRRYLQMCIKRHAERRVAFERVLH